MTLDAASSTAEEAAAAAAAAAAATNASESSEALSFKKDDVLFVDNTLHGGILGMWHAWSVFLHGCVMSVRRTWV